MPPRLNPRPENPDRSDVNRWLTSQPWLPMNWDPTVRRSLLLIALIVGVGVVGYMWIEGWTPWRALFFTLVTLTTVGYEDYGLSVAGERFTLMLLVIGIGVVSYSASQVLHGAIKRATQPERRMLHQAKKMKDHYIVCGLGRTGQRVIAKLADEGVPVVALSTDADAVAKLQERGIVALQDDATSDRALEHAGIGRARALAAVTSSDAVNALICLTARALAPDLGITARAEDDGAIRKLTRAGANHVISPTSYGGDGIAENMLRPEVARLLPGLHDEGYALHFAEVTITEQSPFEGRSVSEIGERFPRLVFIATRDPSGEMLLRPDADRLLANGDVLIVAGTQQDILRVSHKRAA